ncbi:hypothetical protein [Algicella marina]|uniref:Uncharacterized protein n=1 Tax=Algicella marina TaxID=2683284 RepID=A0A6P1SU47_9RHOB|nr:hypothetical protein [Algicella marina]QHQ34214.1 hypothetical protein GO499_02915 [Algicella marina]
MSENTLLVAGGGAIFGAFITWLASPSVPDVEELQQSLAGQIEAIGASTDSLSAEITNLSEKVTAMETSVAEANTASTEATEGLGASFTSAFEGFSGSVSSALSEAAENQSQALSTGLEGLQGSVAEMLAAGGAATSADAAADAPAGEPEGTRPGSTIALADGKIRAFVSRVAADGSGATVALNGFRTVSLATGEEATVELEGESCTVTLDAVDRGHASLSATCG